MRDFFRSGPIIFFVGLMSTQLVEQAREDLGDDMTGMSGKNRRRAGKL